MQIPSDKLYLSVMLLVFNMLIKGAQAMTSCKGFQKECLKTSIQETLPLFVGGMPELGITPLDPFKVDDLKLTLKGGLRVHFRHGVTKGFKKCIVDHASLVGNIFELSVSCNLTITGKYQSSGRLLIFPIDGNGDFRIKCKNISISVALTLGKIQNGGETYLEIQQFKSRHAYNGQVIYRMTNLFNNNPEISKAVLDFMNSNWRMVAEEFGDPLVEFGINSVVNNIKKLLNKVPLKRLTNERLDF